MTQLKKAWPYRTDFEFELGDRCCTKCGHIGPLEHYCKDRRYLFGRKNLCTNCWADSQTARQKRHRDRRRAILQEVKNVPCADCGQRYPDYVMDLDHVHGEKWNSVGGNAVAGNWPEARLRAEIAKCEVVCSNCHRQRSYERGHLNGAAPNPRKRRF